MDETNTKEIENVELNSCEESKVSKKDEFEVILERIKKMSEAVELHSSVIKAVSEKQVDVNYLKYVENSLEDKFFCNAKFNNIIPKVLLEVICPELSKYENIDLNKLEIVDIGSHFEQQENFIDKICLYDNKLINIFSISETNIDKAIKLEQKKFTRVDIINAIKEQYGNGERVELYQFNDYFICIEENRIKIFEEKKVTALLKIEETIFDKMKSKLTKFFTKNIFSKKVCVPNIELIYDTNPNRYKDFKNTSKFDAKARMKVLLYKEREVTRSTN